MAVIGQVTVIGLGLIGGSLGMALRRRRLAQTVVGLSRSAHTIRRAKQRGAVDAGTTDARRAVREADVVVVAAPVDLIVSSAVGVALFMKPGSVLTDVGSTKGAIVSRLERELPARVPFVGGHPIAGSDRRGINAADPALFDGAACILTPTARTNRQALRRVTQLWQRLGCRVTTMSPTAHDRLLADASHLPHAIAYALAHGAGVRGGSCLPRSLLDMTRIAASDPELWDDIFLSNRAALLPAMDRFERAWRRLRRAIASSDRPALRLLLAHAKRRRDAWAG